MHAQRSVSRFPPDRLRNATLTVALWGAAFACGGTESLRDRTRAHGMALSAVTLPRRRRRGVPADLIAQTASLPADASRFLASLSLGVSRLSDGHYLVVHVDSDFRQHGNAVEYFNTTYWASLVSPDLQRACVDEPITFHSTDLARAVFHGDTLMLLGRSVDERGEMRSTQHRYLVTADTCVWETVLRAASQ